MFWGMNLILFFFLQSANELFPSLLVSLESHFLATALLKDGAEDFTCDIIYTRLSSI